jgi:hypothetical protein
MFVGVVAGRRRRRRRGGGGDLIPEPHAQQDCGGTSHTALKSAFFNKSRPIIYILFTVSYIPVCLPLIHAQSINNQSYKFYRLHQLITQCYFFNPYSICSPILNCKFGSESYGIKK